MRKAILDLKRNCRSLRNQVKNVGGKKVYRMLHSINERDEAKAQQQEEEEDDISNQGCVSNNGMEETPVIGHADKNKIVKVF